MFITFLTVVVIAVGTAAYGGPPALSSDASVLKNTYWLAADFANATTGIRLSVMANLYGVYVELDGANMTQGNPCVDACFSGDMCSWGDFGSHCASQKHPGQA